MADADQELRRVPLKQAADHNGVTPQWMRYLCREGHVLAKKTIGGWRVYVDNEGDPIIPEGQRAA